MSVWRTCWQQGRSALEFLSQLLRGKPVALARPPEAVAPIAPPSIPNRGHQSTFFALSLRPS
jgi:hypothetical protein